MFVYIPAEIIAAITFPGVILHEVSHRFFCDLFNIPVFHVNYFAPRKQAGHVIFLKNPSFIKNFFIGYGPLIINTIVCMILTFPFGIAYYFGTEFMLPQTGTAFYLFWILKWIGYTIGFNAIPSHSDVEHLPDLAQSSISKLTTEILNLVIVELGNLDYVGSLVRIGYAYGISLILPMVYWYCF